MNNMINIEVEKIIDPTPASDGAGVKLKRSIGVEPNYYDPFLMLDEFGSENKDDYFYSPKQCCIHNFLRQIHPMYLHLRIKLHSFQYYIYLLEGHKLLNLV